MGTVCSRANNDRNETADKPPERRFLSKLNPDATSGSVVRYGLLSAVVAAALYGLLAYLRLNERFQPTWWGFVAFVLIGFFEDGLRMARRA